MMASVRMDTSSGIVPVEIEGEFGRGTKRRENPMDSPGTSKERKVENWLDLIESEMAVSEVSCAAVFLVYCLEELGLRPEDFALRPLAVLIQHILKCADSS